LKKFVKAFRLTVIIRRLFTAFSKDPKPVSFLPEIAGFGSRVVFTTPRRKIRYEAHRHGRRCGPLVLLPVKCHYNRIFYRYSGE
jgi:hypothetical protein